MNDPGQDPEAYLHIHSVLARRIRGGEYPAGARLPTETELAGEFGCGPGTAARALRALQRDGLARKVLRRGYVSSGPDAQPGYPRCTVPPPPARRIRAAAVCIGGLPPYTQVNQDHQQDVVFADVRTCRGCAARRSVVSRLSREGLGGRFLGLMADLDGKPEGDNSMPGK